MPVRYLPAPDQLPALDRYCAIEPPAFDLERLDETATSARLPYGDSCRERLPLSGPAVRARHFQRRLCPKPRHSRRMYDKQVFSDTRAGLSALSVYLGPFYVPTPLCPRF
jgi:hypothetical protein